MDSTIPEIPNELHKLADNCCKNNIDLIIGTDSNAHHTLWGSKSPNTRGEMVLDFMVESNLRIGVRDRDSPITLSDHMHIQFEICGSSGTKEKFRNKEATKWEIYLIRFKENLINVKMFPSSIVEVNRLATDLKEAIVEAFHFACPEKTIVHKGKNTPWWSKKLHC